MPAPVRPWYSRHLSQKIAGAIVAIGLWLLVRAEEPTRAYVPVRVYGRTAAAYRAAGGVYALVDGSAGALGLLSVRPPVLRARAASVPPGVPVPRPEDVILPRGLGSLAVRAVVIGDRP